MVSSVMVGSEEGLLAGETVGTVAVDAGIPRERVEVMEQPQAATQLWWGTGINGRFRGWNVLESADQIAGLVKSVPEPGDTLAFEDDQPVTRYAQVFLVDEGIFHVEIAALQPDGTYNWRIGMGKEADASTNSPDIGTAKVQELTTAATIEVLTSWAIGQGLPMGYGAALHIYGG